MYCHLVCVMYIGIPSKILYAQNMTMKHRSIKTPKAFFHMQRMQVMMRESRGK